MESATMNSLVFKFEWDPAEGVSHPGLAATWARIEIRAGTHCITRVDDMQQDTIRSGVYGPAMVVAEWIVRNFWFLMFEAAPPEARGASWRRRHSLFASREGTSLPDLALFRDERCSVASWAPAEGAPGKGLRFVERGSIELDPAEMRRALVSAVDTVVERLRGVEHPDVSALRADWDTISELSGDDKIVCGRAARLGVDALDGTELTDELDACLRGAIADLPEATGNDVLDAQIRGPKLAPTIATVRDLTVNGGSPTLRAGGADVQVPILWGMPAFQVGYNAARQVRQKCSTPSGKVDLKAMFAKLGLGGTYREEQSLRLADAHVQALVGASATGTPVVLAAPKPPSHGRFLQARSLFAIAAGAAKEAPRALTSAGTKLQVASRAFAAELLAPAEYLRARIVEGINDEAIEEIAAELEVSQDVIFRQVQNHEIGTGFSNSARC